MSELPSRSAVLPAEIEVLELGLLVALLRKQKVGGGSIKILIAERISGERGYLAEGGHDLRLGIRGRVRLIQRSSLLAACLSAVVVVAGTDKVQEIHQSLATDEGTSGKRTYLNFCFW